jgi:hypothetical protein
MPIAAVEIEVSLQSYEQQTRDGKHKEYHHSTRSKVDNFGLVIATCKELGIAVIAYSYAHAHLLWPFPSTHTQQSAWSWIAHWSHQESSGPRGR